MANTGADADPPAPDPLRVAAAVIRRPDGAILLSLRAPHADQGGLWEFPGGKLEAGERDIDGLARELREELGITIRDALPVIRVPHRYPGKLVSLAVMEVAQWVGTPSGREGQPIRWVAPHELDGFRFPAANVPVTVAVKLPRLALVTPPPAELDEVFLDRLEQCLDAGVRLVRLRPGESGDARSRHIALAASRACRAHDACLLLDGLPGDALAAGAQGLHLSVHRLRQLSARPLPEGLLLSATCRTAQDLAHAEALGADFAFVSPVHARAGTAGVGVLGWHRLHALVRQTRLPVFALGGMAAGDSRLALRAGCQGIAMSHGLWDNGSPGVTLADAARAVRSAAYSVSGEESLTA